MNPALKHVYEETLTLFQEDPRVLAGFMGGSVGTPREDDYSDVDPAFLIAEDAFDVFDADLASLFSQVAPNPSSNGPNAATGPSGATTPSSFMPATTSSSTTSPSRPCPKTAVRR